MSLTVFGWETWHGFLAAAAGSHATYAFGRINFGGFVTPFGGVLLAGGTPNIAYMAQAAATLAAPNRLVVHLVDPGWVIKRSFENLLPDHGHVMHLFLIRWPAMDVMYHLHPKEAAAAFFETSLPSLPGGDYRVYADVVEEDGLAAPTGGPRCHGDEATSP